MNSTNDLRFVKHVYKYEVPSPYTSEKIKSIEVFIKLKNIKTGRSRIHRFTDFLMQYRLVSPKYLSNIADDIVQFLNFIYFEEDFPKFRDITDLTLEMGTAFLEKYSVSKSIANCNRMEQTINKFFYFLYTKNMLLRIENINFDSTNTSNRLVIKSIFKGKYKSYTKESQRPIHDLDNELIFIFLQTAIESCPCIALGIYFQMCGGLRVSEVVSLEYSDISLIGPKGKAGLNVSIHTKDLRPDLKSAFIKGCKRNRQQFVLGFGDLLASLYEYQRNTYYTSDTNAIFIDSKQQPMTEATYRYYFNKLKSSFINKLLSSNNITLQTKGIFLQNQTWSTHILRGVFSNLIANVADNALEVATWRGDRNLDSSLTYLTDTNKIRSQLSQILDKQYQSYGIIKGDNK